MATCHSPDALGKPCYHGATYRERLHLHTAHHVAQGYRLPSGHTNLGWTEALVLAEVAPEHQDEILRCGYQYGYNRLIVGYHWFTDIEATRQLAAALVARLHADPQFLDQLAAARAEYIEKTGGETPVASVAAMPQSSGRSYRLDGTPATTQTRGIVIQDNRKTLRK